MESEKRGQVESMEPGNTCQASQTSQTSQYSQTHYAEPVSKIGKARFAGVCPALRVPRMRERKGAKLKMKTIMLNGSLSPRSVYEN